MTEDPSTVLGSVTGTVSGEKSNYSSYSIDQCYADVVKDIVKNSKL